MKYMEKLKKRMEDKKTVLVNLCDLSNPTCGFGQIALNYGKQFSEAHKDVHFVFLIPDNSCRSFGEKVSYIVIRRFLNKRFSFMLPKVDIWHSVNQQQKLLRLGGDTKFIYTIHDLNFLIEKNAIKAKRKLRKVQKLVDKATVITAISHYVADDLRKHLDLKGKEIRVIYNGVERIDHLPGKQPGFARNRPYFFTIGQIRTKKNFHVLLDVMRAFPEYDLYICGDDHFDYAQFIKEQIQEKCLSNVFLTGKISQDEKVWLYRNCEAFLFPSKIEGFGLPVIEAMQFGKAVFSSNCTSLPEVCGGHAVIWDNFETDYMVQSIRDNLLEFYKDTKRIERMKEYANSFSYEKHIQAYLDLYQELL